ncbi:tRNA (adenine(22)-N(1))-methyltransferase [Colwellia sp. MT41]|uniref:tRNA (adenine(22)-N(1))-methyltransferase n=1 Tax=Colwellia sp. MT41 TaxID=58049 RepID=UPI001E285D0C|nr:tRNA (adenine(22)-N(1))-methyltransferase TrmK [Colwellia sp. MT41]
MKANPNSNMKPSFKHNLKLSNRLQKIEKMVTSQYDHIWDCCCDHGLLGSALLSRQAADTIHFVDIVPDLMAEVENKLQRFYANKHSTSSLSWRTHCLDVAKLPLASYQGEHLIIIAGVGGDLMIKFIEAIYQEHKNLTIDFLLCPVHHLYPLRSKLIELDFSLKDEMLVADNRRFYEILLVSSASAADSKVNKKVSPVGDKIWQSQLTTDLTTDLALSSDEHSIKHPQADIADKYLQKTLNHYQRIQQGKTNDVQHIIDAYRAVTL